MRYECKPCNRKYSGSNIPEDRCCKICGCPLTEYSVSPKADDAKDGEASEEKNNKKTVTVYEAEPDNILVGVPIGESTGSKKKYVSPLKGLQQDGPPVDFEGSGNNVKPEKSPTVVAPVREKTAKPAPAEEPEKENNRDKRVLEGIVIESDSELDAYRTVFEKLGDRLGYGQNFSDTYNRVVVRTEDGEREDVIFYGDVRLGGNYFKKGDSVSARGKFNADNQFMARAIQSNGRWVRITNEQRVRERRERRRRAAYGTNDGRRRISPRLIGVLLIFAVLAAVSIARKIAYMGINDFLVYYIILGGCAGVGATALLNIISPGRQDRNRRWGIIAGIIVLVLLVIF